MRMLITGGLVARADGVFNTDILIEGDRILELGERLHEAQQPEGTEIVDVSGCVVMPGGVDAHTHVNLTVGDAHVSDGFEAGYTVCGFFFPLFNQLRFIRTVQIRNVHLFHIPDCFL